MVLTGEMLDWLKRKKIRAALATLDIPLHWEDGNTQYCGEASAIAVMSIEMDAGVDSDQRTEIDKINSVFFMLIVCSYMSGVLKVPFEEAAMIGIVEFVDDDAELPDVFSKAMTAFEAFTRDNEIVNSVTNVVSLWIADPKQDGYDMLVEMYKTTARIVKS